MVPGNPQRASSPRSCTEQEAPHPSHGPQLPREAAGSSHHCFETEWLTHPVLALTPLRQMQTSKAKFKLQTEVTQALVALWAFSRTCGAPWGTQWENPSPKIFQVPEFAARPPTPLWQALQCLPPGAPCGRAAFDAARPGPGTWCGALPVKVRCTSRRSPPPQAPDPA